MAEGRDRQGPAGTEGGPYEICILVGGLEHVLFSLGIIIPIDFHIFQMG